MNSLLQFQRRPGFKRGDGDGDGDDGGDDGGGRVVNGAPVYDIFWSYLVKFPDDAAS